ncbi:hypothetical protein BB560_001073 [Smittium megazygosporum]|uniref:Myb-like domain-containing protein n=1 Tax=Smittium megazygosporum TaxID=133381 RepID=A0A2T9ZIM4_9FUNG|nr:hypothetical protein BB560_001073 [Smittium megazygosporum]
MDNIWNQSSEPFSWDDSIFDSFLEELKSIPGQTLEQDEKSDLNLIQNSEFNSLHSRNALISDTQSTNFTQTEPLKKHLNVLNYTKKKNKAKLNPKSQHYNKSKTKSTHFLASDPITPAPNHMNQVSRFFRSELGFHKNKLSNSKANSKISKPLLDQGDFQHKSFGDYSTSNNAIISKKWDIKESKFLLDEIQRLNALGASITHDCEDPNPSPTSLQIWDKISLALKKAGYSRTSIQCYKRWRSIYKHLGDQILNFIRVPTNTDTNKPKLHFPLLAPKKPDSGLKNDVTNSEMESSSCQSHSKLDFNVLTNNPKSDRGSKKNKETLVFNESKNDFVDPNDVLKYTHDSYLIPESETTVGLNMPSISLKKSGTSSKKSKKREHNSPHASNSNNKTTSKHIEELDSLVLTGDRFKSKFYCQLLTDIVEVFENPFSNASMAVKRVKWNREQNIEKKRSANPLQGLESSLDVYSTNKNLLSDSRNITDNFIFPSTNKSKADCSDTQATDENSKKVQHLSKKRKAEQSDLLGSLPTNTIPVEPSNHADSIGPPLNTFNMLHNCLENDMLNEIDTNNIDIQFQIPNSISNDYLNETDYYLEFIKSLNLPSLDINSFDSNQISQTSLTLGGNEPANQLGDEDSLSDSNIEFSERSSITNQNNSNLYPISNIGVDFNAGGILDSIPISNTLVSQNTLTTSYDTGLDPFKNTNEHSGSILSLDFTKPNQTDGATFFNIASLSSVNSLSLDVPFQMLDPNLKNFKLSGSTLSSNSDPMLQNTNQTQNSLKFRKDKTIDSKKTLNGLQYFGFLENAQENEPIHSQSLSNPLLNITENNTKTGVKDNNSASNTELNPEKLNNAIQKVLEKYNIQNNQIYGKHELLSSNETLNSKTTVSESDLKNIVFNVLSSLFKQDSPLFSDSLNTSNYSTQNQKLYNETLALRTVDMKTSNIDTDLESLYQEAIQAGEEIKYRNSTQSINESDYFLTDDQMKMLKNQQQQNLQLLLQTYLIECFQNSPHTEVALHWKSQILNIYNINKALSGNPSKSSFLFIPGALVVIPFILYIVSDIHCCFQVFESLESRYKPHHHRTLTSNETSSHLIVQDSAPSSDCINDFSKNKSPLQKNISFSDSKSAEKVHLQPSDKIKPRLNAPVPIAPSPQSSARIKSYTFLPKYANTPLSLSNPELQPKPSHQYVETGDFFNDPEFLMHTDILNLATTPGPCTCIPQSMPTHPFLLENILPNLYTQFVDKNGYKYNSSENSLISFHTYETSAACKVIADQLKLFSSSTKRPLNSRKKNVSSTAAASSNPENISKKFVGLENIQTELETNSENSSNNFENPLEEILQTSNFPNFAQYILIPIIDSLEWSYSLYPNIQMVRRFKNRVSFLPQEDALILLALSHFGFDDTSSISAHFLPCKTPNQIFNRVQNLRARRAPSNPVKDFSLQRILPLNLVQEEAIKAGIFIYGNDFKRYAAEFLSSWPRSVTKRILDNLFSILSYT